jgi:Flp pilus assembly pilin Flp
MQKLAMRLWSEDGFVVSTELVLIATIVVIGLIAGLTTVRDQVTTELGDVADAISEVDQSFSWGNITAHCASVAGSVFSDLTDFCDANTPGSQGDDATGGTCITICGTATSETPG